MAVQRPQLFTPEEVAAFLAKEEEIHRRFDEAARNECVLKELERSGRLSDGYAAVCDGKLLASAPTWEDLKVQLVDIGYYDPDIDYPGIVVRRVGRWVTILDGPAETALFEPAPDA